MMTEQPNKPTKKGEKPQDDLAELHRVGREDLYKCIQKHLEAHPVRYTKRDKELLASRIRSEVFGLHSDLPSCGLTKLQEGEKENGNDTKGIYAGDGVYL